RRPQADGGGGRTARLLQRRWAALGQPDLRLAADEGDGLRMVGGADETAVEQGRSDPARSLSRLRAGMARPGRREDGTEGKMGRWAGARVFRAAPGGTRRAADPGRGPRAHHARRDRPPRRVRSSRYARL